MAQRRNAAEAEDLARLSKDVERWRRTRAKLSPMPAPLWKAAIALARRLGVNPVKNALGLNYRALKVRVVAADEVQPRTVVAELPRFVELSGAQVLGAAATGSVIEVVNAQGARLTVHLAAGAPLDVASLVASFRGQPA